MIRILEGYRLEYEQSELDKAIEYWEKGWSYQDIAITLDIEEIEAFLILTHLSNEKLIGKRSGGILGSVNNDEVDYDDRGYIKKHEYYHVNDGKKWADEELKYIAKFYEFDGTAKVSLALGRTQKSVKTIFQRMKKGGDLEHYRN